MVIAVVVLVIMMIIARLLLMMIVVVVVVLILMMLVVGVPVLMMGMPINVPSPTVSRPIINEPKLMVTYHFSTAARSHGHSPPLRHPQQSLSGLFRPLLMLLHFLRGQIIVMIEHPTKHLYGIGLIPVVILHVGMPHEIGQFVRDDH